MTRPLDETVRTRIAPAPSGDLHVGNVRTALYSWALARRHGGRFILRIEDTDASRVSDEAVDGVQEILRWVGLDWDEGPGVGGPYEPYRQSERLALYAGTGARLEQAGAAYRCYCTPEELAERNAAARAAKRAPGYDGRCRWLSDAERKAFEDEGRSHILRFPMPPGSTTWDDLVRGEITIAHDQIPDFALTRSDGGPLYVLAAAVDDMVMGLTHVVRGEDLIAATPRQMALFAALGHPREQWPDYAHLPLIVADDGKPLSKRNGEVSLRWYREQGFLPETMLNYLALLGWSLAPDRELFDAAEMIAAFDVRRVSRNPARFDIKKLESINGEKIRALDETVLADLVQPWLEQAGLVVDLALLLEAVPLVQTRMTRLTDAVDLLGFLFVDEDEFTVTDHHLLVAEVLSILDAAHAVLEELDVWTADSVKEVLLGALVEGGPQLKAKVALGPIRVAVTGRRVAPPLYESIVLLGRERTLRRLSDALAEIRGW